jgi:hypothetical protein
MRRSKIIAALIVMWLASFLLCLLVPLYFKKDIPSNFGKLIKEAFDTFGPSLAAMIAFVFAGRNEYSQAQPNQLPLADILALVLSLIYVGIFDTLMLMFATHRMDAQETVELFQQYRPYLAFLITGMIAYYFGARAARAQD